MHLPLPMCHKYLMPKAKRSGLPTFSGEKEWQPGPELLREYLKDTGFSHETLAQLLEVSKTTVNGWLNKGKRPSFRMMFVLQKLAHIHPARWMTEEEREHVEKSRKSIERLRRMHVSKPRTIVDKVAGKL